MHNNTQRLLIIIATTLLLVWVLTLLSPILMPFISALLLAYLGCPLIDRLEKRKISRTTSVIIFFSLVLIFSLSLLIIVIPHLEVQFVKLTARIPQFISWSQEQLSRLSVILGINLENVDLNSMRSIVMENMQDIGNITKHVLAIISQSGQKFLVWLAFLILIPVITFYLLRDWDIMLEKIHVLIPRAYAKIIVDLALQCDAVLSEFLRGQLVVMFVQSILYSVGLWIIGLESFLLIGFLTGLLSFVPYLGLIIGGSMAAIAAFMQFQDIVHPLYVLIVFGIVQTIEGLVLSPILIGDRVGLHPVTVIFSVMAGGQLFGFIGLLLALPVAAVITILLRYLYSYYLASKFYNQDG